MQTKQHKAPQKTIRTASFWLLIAFVIQLPYEIDRPLLELSILRFTNVELTLLLVLAVAALQALRVRQHWIPRSWMLVGIWFVIAMLASSLLADALNGNALRASLRTLTGLALMVAVPYLVTTRRQVKTVLTALLISGSLSLLLGWIELERGRALALLDSLRIVPSTAGPFVRLTGSFDYVNQTAMFAEALLPLSAVALVVYQGKRWRLLIPIGLLSIICMALVLSLSRAAWLTAIAILVGAFLWRWIAHRQWQLIWPLAGLIFGLLFAISVWRYPVFALRLQTESDTSWYLIDIAAPDQLTVKADEEVSVSLTIMNQSLRDFRSDTVVPVRIGVRWLDGETQLLEQRYPLPGTLLANSDEAVVVPLKAPKRAGNYQIQWDLVEENIAWFSFKTSREFVSSVTVLENDVQTSGTATFANARPKPVALPPDATRLTLWRTAFVMWQEQPLTGVGLDNFRLTYGSWLGLEKWNEVLHTNNWYIETIVSVGVAGAVPFFGFLLLLLNDMRKATLKSRDMLVWGVALSLLTFYIHGLLDYFLLFNSTGLLFWLLVGVWLRCRQDVLHPERQEQPA